MSRVWFGAAMACVALLLASTTPVLASAPLETPTAVTATEGHAPPAATAEGGAHAATEAHAAAPPVAMVAFFVLLLLAIAILPLVREHWWEHNRNKAIVALALSVPVLVYYLVTNWHAPAHSLLEYVSFIVLLWALYTISGGVVLRGDIAATPGTNVVFLAVGALIANVFGTTGAAMLLIRPLLATNEERQNKAHIVVFFTFLVANVGGCLTPLGDPPLFLGFLRGVPFTWTFSLFPIWLTTTLILLGIFYVWDRHAYAKERPADLQRDATEQQPLRLEGGLNFVWIAGVLAATLLSSTFADVSESVGLYDPHGEGIFQASLASGSPWRELIMVAMGVLSLRFTKRALREANGFTFGAIVEVAVLFAGIFVTMIPALELLQIHGSALGLTAPWHYMWATGMLSSFLDNAPTYLVFATAGTSYVDSLTPASVLTLPDLIEHGAAYLAAISVGAVFMGANTYIGNAPNFMVKAIAESAGSRRVRMPSFFGYMRYSGMVLLPVFAVVTVIFFVLLV